MRTKFLLLVALGVMIVMLTSCSPVQTKLSAADNGRTVDVKVGDKILITLEENPSTGYSWEAKDLDESMFHQVGEAEFKSSNSSVVGAPGTLTLTFDALKAGTSTLTLVYHRSWETDVEPLDTFAITVVAD